ncbi:MAG: hypothetical protein QNK25_10450, partial [Desulfobacterales bacterium]|nr:hypothetical protein [Desulfobacterales bacterium]
AFADWCIDHGIECRFKALISQPFTDGEDVWKHKTLLSEATNWVDDFDYVIQRLKRHGHCGESRVLQNIKDSLVQP